MPKGKYRRSDWIKADSKEDAIQKIKQENDCQDSEIELSFQMSDEEWARDMKREYQGD